MHHNFKQSTNCVCPLPLPQLPHASGLNRHCRCQASAPGAFSHALPLSGECSWCLLPCTTTSRRAHRMCVSPATAAQLLTRKRIEQALPWHLASASGAPSTAPQLQAEHTLCVSSATAATPTRKRTEELPCCQASAPGAFPNAPQLQAEHNVCPLPPPHFHMKAD